TQIQTLADWAHNNAPAGNPTDAPPPRKWAQDYVIPHPDLVIAMPKPVAIPAHGDIAYTYEIVHTNFREDRWVRMSEIRPTSRAHIHHAVVYIRPPNSTWVKQAPIGTPFTAMDMKDEQSRHDAEMTTSDILLVYAPGSSPDEWPEGMAKL